MTKIDTKYGPCEEQFKVQFNDRFLEWLAITHAEEKGRGAFDVFDFTEKLRVTGLTDSQISEIQTVCKLFDLAFVSCSMLLPGSLELNRQMCKKYVVKYVVASGTISNRSFILYINWLGASHHRDIDIFQLPE